ncbi:MAG TPA: SDR family NAD(P)-dependent oxidoreductase [Stellaceae bacterium]|nr:SDR family NAD(P)-dependent oxidoreductase [Stellaceae bacterium]
MRDAAPLRDQVAIVTGAAQGIGRGIATVLAEAGARVVIGDLQDASGTLRDVEAAGSKGAQLRIDVSSRADAEKLVAFALQSFGRLDILVNNAAIDAPEGNAWDLPEEEWRRTIDVNLSGVFYCSQAALKPMLAAGRGVIINLSSQSARVGRHGMSPAYNASKAGVIGLTIAFSAQVAERGVRVNAVMPGLVESRDFGWSPEMRAARMREYPLGLGTPRDVGEAVLYLASPAARWVSGSLHHVAGGYQRPASWL